MAAVETAACLPPRWVLALCLAVSWVGLFERDLWTPDEPREAALALDMSRTRDYAIPRLAHQPFVEKPPLYYVVGATAIRWLGSWLGPTAALRVTSVLWGWGTLGMTWLLARRLAGRDTATLAVLVLATLPGFIHVSHWLLVDNALVFFMVGALWCLAEAYLDRRPAFLLAAGLMTAGAFLAKGLIGPILIALGWVGLMAARWGDVSRPIPQTVARNGNSPTGNMERRWMAALGGAPGVVWHGAGVLLLVLAAGAWMAALRLRGGPDLWHEWFWNNHFGRFSGQARQLGHIAGPFYYLGVIPLYLLPWLTAWLMALAAVGQRVWRRERLEAGWWLLLAWGLGGLLLLTLSSTKREIYLIVLLPAWAIMIARYLREPLTRSVRVSVSVWAGVCVALLGLLGVAGCLLPWTEYRMPVAVSLPAGMAGCGGAVLAWVIWRRTAGLLLARGFALTALAALVIMAAVCPVVDRVKSYGPAFRELGAALTAARPDSVAGWGFDETTRAGLYYYGAVVLPEITTGDALRQVLRGEHPTYRGLLVNPKRFPPPDAAPPAWRVLRAVRMGRNRALWWIEGMGVDGRGVGEETADANR